MAYIYYEGTRISIAKAFAIIEALAYNRGYDPADAAEMLAAALSGEEDYNDQLVGDFSIEVLA